MIRPEFGNHGVLEGFVGIHVPEHISIARNTSDMSSYSVFSMMSTVDGSFEMIPPEEILCSLEDNE